MDKLNLATIFSGIGAIEQALIKKKIPYNIIFASDNGERDLICSLDELKIKFEDSKKKSISEFVKNQYDSLSKPNYVKQSYFANYSIREDQWYEDVRFIDGTKYEGKVDMLVGGSPCQSFSIIGKRAGLDDARGTLFYDFARLVKETKPKVFIFENVPGMLTHDKGKTWKQIKEIFESLDYKFKYTVLNSKDFGIPQNRKRLFVVGWKDKNKEFYFPRGKELTTTMFDYLEKNVAARHFLGKKGFEFVTNEKYKNRARVNQEIIQTQKANQQFNWNGDFVFVPYEDIKNNKEILERAYIGIFKGERGAIRQLTYRESIRLMGFPDDFKIVVPNVPAYRQIGNSIVVTVLEAIVEEIYNCEIL
ncbi:MAG: DNA cytosine methyltransferase [Erysipelotrichia bacterium]|nr:DNA cytosine methyltransferase [Erysipelotrichia bacterium]